MSVLTTRLRQGIEPYDGIQDAEKVMDMAADMIDGLRDRNERLSAALSWIEDHEPVLVDQARERFLCKRFGCPPNVQG